MNTAIASQVGQSSWRRIRHPGEHHLAHCKYPLGRGKGCSRLCRIIQVKEEDEGLIPMLIEHNGPADKAAPRVETRPRGIPTTRNIV